MESRAQMMKYPLALVREMVSPLLAPDFPTENLSKSTLVEIILASRGKKVRSSGELVKSAGRSRSQRILANRPGRR